MLLHVLIPLTVWSTERQTCSVLSRKISKWKFRSRQHSSPTPQRKWRYSSFLISEAVTSVTAPVCVPAPDACGKMVFGGRAFGKSWGHEGGAPRIELVPWWQETPRACVLSALHHRQTRHQVCWHFNLGHFQPPELWEINVCHLHYAACDTLWRHLQLRQPLIQPFNTSVTSHVALSTQLPQALVALSSSWG